MSAADVVTIDRATAEQLVVTLEAVEKARRSIEAALGLSEHELEALTDRGSELWFNEWQKTDERLMCEAFGRRLAQVMQVAAT